MKNTVKQIPPEKTYWYLMNPDKFDINQLEANEMLQKDGSVLAKVPQIADRIRIRRDKNENQPDVELVIGREMDPETGEVQEETVVIGTEIGGYLSGMMRAKDIYHDYFNTDSRLIHDPLKRQQKPETEEPMKEEKPGKGRQMDGRPAEERG